LVAMLIDANTVSTRIFSLGLPHHGNFQLELFGEVCRNGEFVEEIPLLTTSSGERINPDTTPSNPKFYVVLGISNEDGMTAAIAQYVESPGNTFTISNPQPGFFQVIDGGASFPHFDDRKEALGADFILAVYKSNSLNNEMVTYSQPESYEDRSHGFRNVESATLVRAIITEK